MAARVSFFLMATALLAVHSRSESAGVDSEHVITDAPAFSYSGNTGPAKWGSLSPTYQTCNGKLQSPIDIVKGSIVHNKKLKPLKREYHSVNATLINHGFNVGLFLGNAGPLIVDGKNYTLQQIHWHSPSEHKINGVPSDAELHLVHRAGDGSISVIAILYKYGDADPILAKIHSELAELAKEDCAPHEVSQIAVGIFDTWKLRRNTRKYYRYKGSLTTPPCTQNVLWHVFPKVRSISREQVEALKAPLLSTCKSNSRPVQPLNGRRVELFDELA